MADYFVLSRKPNPDDAKHPMIATAAILQCDLCNHVIAGMGGPEPGAICDRCANLLRTGQLRGLVKTKRQP